MDLVEGYGGGVKRSIIEVESGNQTDREQQLVEKIPSNYWIDLYI
jgi:hypothetical protein